MSTTIELKTNQHRLIANLRYAFTEQSMLGELLQNARRAQASQIHITVTDDTLTVSDDGHGIADLQTLIHIAESGWDGDLQSRENAFGMGILSTLYFAQRLSVHSLDKAFEAPTVSIINGDPIRVQHRPARTGTEISLQRVNVGCDLSTWVEDRLRYLCRAFPIPVWFNGSQTPRPLADPTLRWRETTMGKVLINLSAPPTQWRCFLQGLPIGTCPLRYDSQVILLPDDTLARLPDRQSLLNEMRDYQRIDSAVELAYREALIDEKKRLPASQFIAEHAATCLGSSNADLLNDIPVAPLDWFRSWEHEPAGFRRYWESFSIKGIVYRDILEAAGVWQIEDDWEQTTTAEVYLDAKKAWLLEETRLDNGHWLNKLTQTISAAQIDVKAGTPLLEDRCPDLGDGEVELVLVETLSVSLKGHTAYPVKSIRQGNTLFLTPESEDVTPLIADYIVDDRYDQEQRDLDKEVIRTFITVGRSQSPDQVVNALLPQAFRHKAYPQLVKARVVLIFDKAGKLKEVTTDTL